MGSSRCPAGGILHAQPREFQVSKARAVPYDVEPTRWLQVGTERIACFTTDVEGFVDQATVESFGEEWDRFNAFTAEEIEAHGDEYFDIVSPDMLGPDKVALDVGCGSGRWSQYLLHRVGFVEAVDPSSAVCVASRRLTAARNVRVTQAAAGALPFPPESFDFVIALGVLHHMPDTAEGLRSCVRALKPGGHILVYLYYALDGRGPAYKALWRLSDRLRLVCSRLPAPAKRIVADLMAALVYWPLARLGRVLALVGLGRLSERLPLAFYSGKSFYVMRTDALDRFGTPLERRFRKEEIEGMLSAAGLDGIQFSLNSPFWHVVAKKV
jgi:ubiquinone/menaquinone biosynthesis C-methylase UbiE